MKHSTHRRYIVMLYILSGLFIVLIGLLWNGIAEEDIIIQDHSKSLSEYCHSIAELNYVPFSTSGLREALSVRYLVLCKTKKQDVEFDNTQPVQIIQGPENRYILVYSSWEIADKAILWLNKQDSVIYAEHDGMVTASSQETGEVSFLSQGAEQLNLRNYLILTRDYGTGSQTVAVIDSGVSKHSVLSGRIKTYGYDYVDVDTDPTNDLSGHGTHVAGIIADCTQGTPVWIYPIRVLNSVGSGKMSNVIAAVLEAVDAGVDVINLSLESFEMSEALDDAIEEAVKQGILVVIAAGNHSCDTSQVCPAHLTAEGVVVVGSVEASGNGFHRADYSNFGNSVDLYAFGSSINSCSRNGGYVVQSGTSMAAAHVSGVCALMRMTHPGISPQTIERRLISVCRDFSIPVLDVTGFVPASRGFYMSGFVMDKGDALNVPIEAMPLTSHANITWQSANESVLAVESDGCLRAVNEGTTELVTSCMGFDDILIAVKVLDEDCLTITLPAAMTTIEDEAFLGTGGKHIVLPNSVETIGDGAFADCGDLQTIVIPASVVSVGNGLLEESEQAIILCSSGSMIQAYADEHKLQYIAVSN